MNNDSLFIKHTSCPQCGSRDNLGVYTDHVYCFGCGYHTFVDNGRPNNEFQRDYQTSKGANNNNNDNPSVSLVPDYDTHIPPLGLEWLNKYHLTPQEIYGNRIGWSENGILINARGAERDTILFAPCLIFPVFDGYGNLLMWQGRYFGGERHTPKYYTRGGKDLLHILGRRSVPTRAGKESDSIVLTEDLISAIKVSRVTRAMPLFGASINQTQLVRLLSQTDSLVFWLDSDKEKEARRLLKRASQWFSEVRVVASNLDPKEYSTEEIILYLDKGRES